MREPAHRPATGDADRLAEREALLAGRADVDRDLARPRRPAAFSEPERVEARLARVDAEAERRIARRDRLALLVDQPSRSRRSRRRPPRRRAAPSTSRGARPARWRRRSSRSSTTSFPDDDGVRARVGVGEEGVDRLLDRVGEDVRAAHHRHAEHDREHRQRGAELAPSQSLERDPDHRRAHLLHRGEHLVGARAAELLDHAPVGEEEDPVGDRRGVRVVRHHHGRLADRLSTAPRRSSRISALVFESRLPVGSSAKTHGRLRDERASDRDALLLAAGQLARGGAGGGRRGRPRSSSSATHSRSGLRPASASGSTTFSSAVSIGSRLKNWKTKPMWRRRSFVSSVSPSR